ncbi:hypothetical protein K505DRAFT_337462 [Melanomma pulvis-pyrius CBS 109.77]|uniref:Uncharacterized protein n=1 Tax=Melanomma pulvis-pyrius CBS 109.77 TaxID=1314802 RepID=A0A6A6XC02_9PLEO|nr:hypothetical protein K505DRAFT_337462 [Melanomma pulvis-pyrius CBS 109.77]
MRPTEYGRVINRNFNDESNKNNIISYKKGMQGQFLEERLINTNTQVAKIYIQGVTDDKGYANRWVPPVKLLDFTDQHGGPAAVSQTIITGIKAAGLFKILNTDNFTVQDLVDREKCTIIIPSSSKKAGVYARFHRSGSTMTHWKPNTTYGYIGFSKEFDDCFHRHAYMQALYSDLTRNSTKLASIALRILGSELEHEYFYLTEQVFVCMLQTYRASLSLSPSGNSDTLSFTFAAKYFFDISNEVFRISSWGGAISRPSFGISEGVNYSSPLLEYASVSDKTLFIRTDVEIRDGLSGRLVPMAFFRRAKQDTVPLNGNLLAFTHREIDIGNMNFRHEPWTDGMKGPVAGTPYQLIFEVRKDGTPHPQSWTRLPEVGPFKNWNQARSWAVRIEWEHPKNSGMWRFTYLQAGYASGGGLFDLADKNVPGSLKVYAKSIQFVQWLCNSQPAHTYD